jgi:hypothetical protein
MTMNFKNTTTPGSHGTKYTAKSDKGETYTILADRAGYSLSKGPLDKRVNLGNFDSLDAAKAAAQSASAE